MKPLLYYLLQVIVASGILYGYYHLALRNKKFHKYNRFYLLASTIISITIPFLNIPVYITESDTNSSFVLQTLTNFSVSSNEASVVYDVPKTNWFTVEIVMTLIYVLIAGFIFLRIIFSLFKIKRIIKNNPVEKIDSINFINTTEPGTPFSFFRWLFWNNKIELNSEKGEQIFRHELFHINQKHSWDIIYLELLTVLFWINPFFHLIKKETKAVHEFLADQFAVTENSKWEYAELLLMQVLNTQQRLVTPFFHNQIKRRIAMLTTSKKPSHQYLRKLMVFPVAAIVIGLFAFTYKQKDSIKKENEKIILEEKINRDTTTNPKPQKIEWIELFIPEEKKIPTIDQFKTWTDEKIYGVWLDGKRINNTILSKYKPSEIALYSISKLAKNTFNYGKHFYQVNLFSNSYYEKMVKNKKPATGKYIIISDTTAPESLLGDRFEKSSIVIDGKIGMSLNSVKVNEILSFTILKGQDAINKYGDQGKNGVVEITTKNNPGKIVQKNIDENNISAANKIFTQVEVPPSFPGGDNKWNQYVKAQLNQKIPIQNGAKHRTYTVVVQFLVRTDSTLTNIKALTNHGFGMEEEAIRLVSKGPRWNPAIQNGKQVNAIWNQPVTFVLSEKAITKSED